MNVCEFESKARLLKAARQRHGEIEPKCFTRDTTGTVVFWFRSAVDNRIHSLAEYRIKNGPVCAATLNRP